MSDSDKSKPAYGPGRDPRSLANLKPAKPGDIRNPKGVNQYSYKEDGERDFAELAKKRFRRMMERMFERAEEDSTADAREILARIVPIEKRLDLNIGSDALGLLDRLDAYFAERGEGSVTGEYSDPGSDGD